MKSLEKFILQSWWVVLFSILCLFFYEHMQKSRKDLYNALNKQLDELFAERQQSLDLKHDLLGHINSQSDPAYVELTLMKILGVVPENQVKVYFKGKSAAPHD